MNELINEIINEANNKEIIIDEDSFPIYSIQLFMKIIMSYIIISIMIIQL